MVDMIYLCVYQRSAQLMLFMIQEQKVKRVVIAEADKRGAVFVVCHMPTNKRRETPLYKRSPPPYWIEWWVVVSK